MLMVVLFDSIHYILPRKWKLRDSDFWFFCNYEYFRYKKSTPHLFEKRKMSFFLWKAKISCSSGVNKLILRSELNNDNVIIIIARCEYFRVIFINFILEKYSSVTISFRQKYINHEITFFLPISSMSFISVAGHLFAYLIIFLHILCHHF